MDEGWGSWSTIPSAVFSTHSRVGWGRPTALHTATPAAHKLHKLSCALIHHILELICVPTIYLIIYCMYPTTYTYICIEAIHKYIIMWNVLDLTSLVLAILLLCIMFFLMSIIFLILYCFLFLWCLCIYGYI